jgi:2-amino-4-hydroxy-6-hydroxymethyldihydropteridine diphosphokinase
VATAYIGVGSNIDPERNVAEAMSLMARQVTVTAVSTFYLTEPVGDREGPSFYNGVARIETSLPPEELKNEVLRGIERSLGRVRGPDKYAPRPIDLDILLYNGLVTHGENLRLPDPDIYTRPFLAVPLLELDPGLVLPDSGRPLREVAAAMEGHGMRPVEGYTEIIRRKMADES